MSYRKSIRLGVAVLVVTVAMTMCSWAQSDGAEQNPAPASDQGSSQEGVSGPSGTQQLPDANGPTPPPYALTVPIVGVNLPPRVIGGEIRSFLLPAFQLSAGANTDQRDGFGPSDTYATVRGLGSLSMQKLWSRYDFGADYLGGVAYLGNRSLDRSILQAFHVDQHVSWSTGQLEVRDAFTYLPDGDFGGSAFGGAPALAGLNGGFTGGIIGTSIFGPGQFATLGQQPRITNLALGDITQYLSARSSIGLVTSYGLTHFTDDKLNLINSWQLASEASYDYQLSRRDQLAVLYAHQTFRYPSAVGDNIDTNLVNVLFGRRISGRMEFIAGGGPQFTHIETPVETVNTPGVGVITFPRTSVNRITGSGRVSLNYKFKLTDFSLAYLHYTTNGSGFFEGATTNIFRVSGSRAFSRLWGGQLDVGYNKNQRVISAVTGPAANSFNYVFAGAGVHRQLTREVSAFVSFQFSNINFNAPFCVDASCGRTSQREIALFGLDWHPHPIRME